MSLQPNDTYLVARVAVMHDKKAFDALVCKYQSRLRRFFLSQTLGDSQLSDDLAQDTFVKAYVGISGFRGMSSFSTWLFRIAWRVLYDYARSHRPTATVVPPWQPAASSPTGRWGWMCMRLWPG